MIDLGPDMTVVGSTYQALKTVLLARALPWQYQEDAQVYYIFGVDTFLAFACTIWKGEVPYSVALGGYTQVQNDADKLDFETNYKASANASLFSRTEIVRWFGSTAPTVGQKTAANSIPVALASDQTITVVVQGSAAPRRGFIHGMIVLSATSIVPVEETTYTEQTDDARRSLVSTSASDAAAGTGARTVKITYFTATMTGPFTETVTLNGTTPVNTVASNLCFIEKMEVLTVGSSGATVGTINLKAATAGGGATIWSIAIGDTLTSGAHHYVPAGATHYVTGCTVGIKGGDSAAYALRAKNPLNANDTNQYITSWVRTATNSSFTRSYYTPIELVGPMRVVAWVWPDSTSSRTYFVEYDYYEQ
jgi:hypothetical protein